MSTSVDDSSPSQSSSLLSSPLDTNTLKSINNMCVSAIVDELGLLLGVPTRRWFEADVFPCLRGDIKMNRDELLLRLKHYVNRVLLPTDSAIESEINRHFESRRCQMTCLLRVMCRDWASKTIDTVSGGHLAGADVEAGSATLSSEPLQTCGCNEFPTAAEFWLKVRESVSSLHVAELCRLCVLLWKTQFDPTSTDQTFRTAVVESHVLPVMTKTAYDVYEKLLGDAARIMTYRSDLEGTANRETSPLDAPTQIEEPSPDLKAQLDPEQHPGPFGSGSTDAPEQTYGSGSISGASEGNAESQVQLLDRSDVNSEDPDDETYTDV